MQGKPTSINDVDAYDFRIKFLSWCKQQMQSNGCVSNKVPVVLEYIPGKHDMQEVDPISVHLET